MVKKSKKVSKNKRLRAEEKKEFEKDKAHYYQLMGDFKILFKYLDKKDCIMARVCAEHIVKDILFNKAGF